MIDLITSRDLEELTDVSADHCVSLLLPTYRSGPDTAEAPIRLKKLLSRAASELVSLGERPPDADQLLSPATALLHDSDFWAHQASGLVIYLTADSMRTFRLPQLVQELVVVADRFHLNPLISCGASAASFHVLALSQHVRRFDVSMNDPVSVCVMKSIGDFRYKFRRRADSRRRTDDGAAHRRSAS